MENWVRIARVAHPVSELMENMALEHAGLDLGRPSQSHGGQSFVLDRFRIGSDSGAPSVDIFEGDAHGHR